MSADIIVFGSAIVDFICYAKRLPKPGETLHGHKFQTGYGGKGANQCVAAAKLGASTCIIAKVGDDNWGKKYVEHLRKEGVIADYVEQCNGQTTGIAQISVADNGENNIIIVVGANNLLSTEDVHKNESIFAKAKVLICQLETPIEATIAALHKFKGISILNAAPAMSNTPKELLKYATILCVNESEAALMIGVSDVKTLDDAKHALKELIKMGANTVIITLGPVGAVYAKSGEPSKCIHVPTCTVEKVVDTTGAGDAFIGSLAYFMSKYPNLPLNQQIGGACEVASYSVQHTGTQSSFPSSKDINLDLHQKKYVSQII